MTGGPLAGLRVVELAGIGPGPHAGMQLADLGADVVRVVRPDSSPEEYGSGVFTMRGRTSVVADLKDPADREAVLALVARADVFVEGMRPGTTERLGLGPDDALARNPRLVYARMTGWGQDGPLAGTAGHDINYISLTGALHAVGPAEHPVPPLNLVGDYGGGSMFLMVGILSALFERVTTGRGQVIDAGMLDGAAALLGPILELRTLGMWKDDRAANLLDGAAPYYRTYACADGGHMAVGAIEPQFYLVFLAGLGLDAGDLPDRDDRGSWAALAERFAAVFLTRTREEWTKEFDGTDACVTPVLSFTEAPHHPHVAHRRSLVDSPDGVMAAPAPRFSRSLRPWTTEPTGSTTSAGTVLARWLAGT